MAQPPRLSASEQAQLGAVRLRRDGTPSAHPYPTAELWPRIREHLVARSRHSNPRLEEVLTAYTPGETLELLGYDEIKRWHQEAVDEVGDYETIVLVPCAKTKPWVGPAVSRSKLYSAYNALRPEHPSVCFATISEPLGIVPMQDWGDFPQYDNPGLFRDDAQQSGMTKKDWQKSPFGQWYGLPFDEAAWRQSIDTIGEVVAAFLDNHRDRKILSVVDDVSGRTTHGAMLDVAVSLTGVDVARYPKRLEARVSPLGYLRDVLNGQRPEAQLAPARPQLLPLDVPAAAVPSASLPLELAVGA
jgi:hypothetical protein